MKKIALLALLGAFLSTALVADDYFIGSGTSTQNKVPTYGYNNYGWSKFIYTGDELATAGVGGTISITGLAFQVSNSISNYVMDNQLIYMRYAYNSNYTSTDTAYPNPLTGGWTYVYNGSVTWDGPGWNTISFTTPFSYTYTEGQNWGIEILWENRDGSKIGGPPSFYGSTISNTCVYKHQDASFPTSNGSRGNYHPNLWLMTPPTDVPPTAIMPIPADIETDVPIETNISWSSGGGAPDFYRFSLWKTDPLEIIENNLIVYGRNYAPAGYLSYGTNYAWRVIPHNSFGDALGCPTWSFTTLADPSISTFPWTESFDGSSFPPSNDWLRRGGELIDPLTLTPNSLWEQVDWLNISGNTDKAAAINIWGSLNGWLISPLLNVSDPNFWLIFDLAWLKSDQPPTGTPPDPSGVDDRFAVLIGDGFSWSTANIVREWNNTGSDFVLNNINPFGEKVAIPLADHTGHIRIAFYAGSTSFNADNDFMVNNLYVGEYLSEPVVSIARDPISGLTGLSWTPVTGATGYEIYNAADPYGVWNYLDSTSATSYSVDPNAEKNFFRVKAVNAD